MNTQTAIAVTPADPSTDRAEACGLSLAERLDAEMAEMTERHLRHLAELAEIGMALSRDLARRAAEGPAEGADPGELALSLNRVTRAVRLTMTMEAKVREAARARLLGLEADRVAEATRIAEALVAAEKKRVQSRETLILNAVEDAANAAVRVRHGVDPIAARESLDDEDEDEFDEDEIEEIDGAVAAASRLLDRDRTFADYADRPVGEVLAQVFKALGLTPDWRLWANEDWAVAETQARPPGSPYAAPLPPACREDAIGPP